MPYNLRVDDETKLSPRKHVYQLISYLWVSDRVIPYHVVKPEHAESQIRYLQRHGGERVINFLFDGDFPERLGITTFKGCESKRLESQPKVESLKTLEVEPEEVDSTVAGATASPAGPAVVEQPSAIDEIPRTKREEIRGESEDDNKKRLPETKLGKTIVACLGIKYMTKRQERRLA